MRASSILLTAASLLVASTNAECGQLAPSEIALIANCGNTAELAECLTPADKCIKKCLALAGCSDVEAANFATWFHNDCKETRTLGDLRKRQNNNNEEEEKPAPAPAPPAETKADDPGTRQPKPAETTAAEPETQPAKTPDAVITPAETAAPAETQPEMTLPALSTPVAETPATEAQITTEAPPDETIVATVTDSKGKTILTTAAASLATLAKPLVCLTTRFVDAESCTKEKGAATSVCVPTKTPEIGCGPGLLCQMTERGQQICMKKQNLPNTAGTIVIICLAIFLATMIGTVTYMACKTKKEEEREKKKAEALAIANGLKAPGPGGPGATDAYVPLMGSRGRARDSSANPFGGGSGRNSRRPSTLGMGAHSPGGYGGMAESRSPVDSRAPSPLGMPGATEDLSYGGGRRI